MRVNTVKAWKDPEYRAGLSDAERAALADNPAGLVELGDGDIDGVAAATGTGCVIGSIAISVTLTINVCSLPFGSCEFGTRGCC